MSPVGLCYPFTRRNLQSATVLMSFAAILSSNLGGATPAQTPQAPDSSVCFDEAKLPSSKGALRKINGQVQRCDGANRWVYQPMKTDQAVPQSADKGAAKKDCKGEHGQTYESGLFRPIEKAYERCADGKWLRDK